MLLAALALLSPGIDFVPIDDAPNDVQFAEFRQNLIGSIEKKNYDWALPRIAPDIKFSFGEDGNKRELLKLWAAVPSAKEEFFDELLKCLKLGGQFKTYDKKRYFVAPYVFSAWPDELDAFEYVAVPHPLARVYASADDTTEPVTSIGHTIVRVDYGATTDGWHRIEYKDGEWGWVKDESVRSPISYRALFEKNEVGSYVLKTFVAGD